MQKQYTLVNEKRRRGLGERTGELGRDRSVEVLGVDPQGDDPLHVGDLNAYHV